MADASTSTTTPEWTHPTIFINLPVTSVSASKAFYASLGFTNVPSFSNAETVMMRLSSSIAVMLHEKTARFTTWVPEGRTVIDAKTHTEVLLAISCPKGTWEVDEWVEKARAAGGTVDVGVCEEMKDERGNLWMYGRSFDDLDGHVWEVCWMSGESE